MLQGITPPGGVMQGRGEKSHFPAKCVNISKTGRDMSLVSSYY